MSFFTLPPSPDSSSHSETKSSPRTRSLKVLTHPFGAAASADYASESELGQSPGFTSSEPSSATLDVPIVTVDSPQMNEPCPSLSPTNRWRSNERSRQLSPSVSRNNSLASDPGGGFEEWRCDQPFQFKIPGKDIDDPWEAGYKLAREHDKEMCDAWREGVDKLLLFAGLFSAALVAFLTISCPMLNQDPNDIHNDYLLRITTQLSQLQIQAGATNVPLPPLPPPSDAFRPSSQVFVANICWFLSLTVALGTVLFGTVCLQWIREFQRDPRLGRYKEAFEFRQMRYEGLMGWGVPFILSSLPLLIQLSLLLFFLGLSFFLQSFDLFIAATISVLMALIVVFLCVTMMLPAMQCITSSSKNHGQRSSLCPFKSPHARLVGVFASWSFLCLIDIFRFFSSNPDAFQEKRVFFEKMFRSGSGWTSVDMAWLQTSYPFHKESCPHSPEALAWLANTYTTSHDALRAFYYGLRDIKSSTAIETLQKLKSVKSTNTDIDWTAEYDGEHSKDIQSAFALDNFVAASPQLHESLLAHRVELFVRILNQGLFSKIGRRPGADVCSLFEKKLLAVPLVGDTDFVILPDVCKLQLIKTFTMYLEFKKIPNFLADVVIKIVYKTITTKPLTSYPMLREDLSEFNKRLHLYLDDPDKTLRHNVKEVARKYVDQFGDDGYTGSKLKLGFSSFRTSFKQLQKQVQVGRGNVLSGS